MDNMQIMNISGVDCYEKDGTAYLKLDAVARGLGFTRIADSGNEVIRWERVYRYLNELNYVPTSGHDHDGFIPENIFYRLAMKAKNQVAEAFQAKVADEIIPSIRKTGMYATPQAVENILNNPDAFIEMLQAYKTEKEKNKLLEEQAAINAPKVVFHDQIADCTNAIKIGELAKLMKQNGYDIGQNRLFELLRNDGYLLSGANQWNKPSQYAMNLGLFKIVERVVEKNGYKEMCSTTYVTTKGIKYFLTRYLVDSMAGQPLIPETI